MKKFREAHDQCELECFHRLIQIFKVHHYQHIITSLFNWGEISVLITLTGIKTTAPLAAWGISMLSVNAMHHK